MKGIVAWDSFLSIPSCQVYKKELNIHFIWFQKLSMIGQYFIFAFYRTVFSAYAESIFVFKDKQSINFVFVLLFFWWGGRSICITRCYIFSTYCLFKVIRHCWQWELVLAHSLFVRRISLGLKFFILVGEYTKSI